LPKSQWQSLINLDIIKVYSPSIIMFLWCCHVLWHAEVSIYLIFSAQLLFVFLFF
jgi:hypothetical protein